jgi:hypothetical protein
MKQEHTPKGQKRQAKVQRRRQRRKRERVGPPMKAVCAEKPAAPHPKAGGYLVHDFWEKMNFGQVLAGLGQVKSKGLSLRTLFMTLMLFGVMNAQSDSDLSSKVKADPLLGAMYGVEQLDRQQVYRLRKRLNSDEYDEWLEHVLRQLQADPRTARRSDGVVSGDDTVFFKSGRKMADITLVYKSSEKRYGLGYVMPTTHYADGDKNYPLFGRIHKRTEEQKQEAADKRSRRRQKLDGRRPEDEKAWMSQLVADGRIPEVVVLRGARLCPGFVRHCADLKLAWLGVSPANRRYTLAGSSAKSAKELLQQTVRESQWQILNEEGARYRALGQAATTTLGQVTLIMVESMADGERLLYLAPAALDADAWLTLLESALADEQSAPENSKLQDMLTLLAKSMPFIQAETATFDGWFYVPWFLQQVLALGFQRIVLPAKTNRAYTAHGVSKTWQEWEREGKDARRISLLGRYMSVRQRKVHDPDLGHVQLVFIQDITRKQRNGQPVDALGKVYCLVCTDPKWAPDKVVRAYKLRWKIEEFYREVRQNHGLTRFHSPDQHVIHGHLIFAFISYLCVALTRLWHPSLKALTLGAIKRQFFQALVTLELHDDILEVTFPPDWVDHLGLPNFDALAFHATCT